MTAIRPATHADAFKVKRALGLLREARDLLKEAGAVKAAEAVRPAIKSTDGAVRHVSHRIRRSS